MAGISFSVFKSKILDGSKRQTIRKKRQRPIGMGNTLHLWWEQGSKDNEKLGIATCTATQDFEIDGQGGISVDGQPLTDSDTEALAIADGFINSDEFVQFFSDRYGLPFSGVIIHWGELI